jgi:RNA polymerase sigma-70 factor (ECF subfamily)
MWDIQGSNPFRELRELSGRPPADDSTPHGRAPLQGHFSRRMAGRPTSLDGSSDRDVIAEEDRGPRYNGDAEPDFAEFEVPASGEAITTPSENEEKLSAGDEPQPEEDEIWCAETQLSSPKGVRQDMGTIALERSPAGRIYQDKVGGPAASAVRNGDFSQMTDAEIMLRAGAGDDASFEFLAAKYRRPIVSFMYRLVHNQAIAEELAQEVFLRVYRARESYRAEARFTTWLYRIASNMAINHARDTKSERSSSSVYLDQADEETGTTPDVPDLRPLADQDMLRQERMRSIREQVMALPDRQRMAVVMHKYQDMDYKQIGAVLKLSESATKSLLFRAYQTLRERLKEFA